MGVASATAACEATREDHRLHVDVACHIDVVPDMAQIAAVDAAKAKADHQQVATGIESHRPNVGVDMIVIEEARVVTVAGTGVAARVTDAVLRSVVRKDRNANPLNNPSGYVQTDH